MKKVAILFVLALGIAGCCAGCYGNCSGKVTMRSGPSKPWYCNDGSWMPVAPCPLRQPVRP